MPPLDHPRRSVLTAANTISRECAYRYSAVVTVQITVLYDNERVLESMRTGWGFSALVDEDVVFDTGGNADALLGNMDVLGVDVHEIDTVVLSHGHSDHTGGLLGLLEETGAVTILAPSRRLSESLRRSVPESVEVMTSDAPTNVRDGVVTTGALGGGIREQGLVCEGDDGAVLVTGCAHPGLDALLDAAGELADVTGVVGGFHDFERLDALDGLELVCPCHCTQRKEEIASRFPETCVRCGAGLVVEV